MSPDGSKIVFGSPSTGLGDIYVVDHDGRNRRRLTDHPAYDGEPRFTPDGKKILFVSERDNGSTGHIYVMDADGSNQHALTHSEYYDVHPSASPDGSRIVFARNPEKAPRPISHTAIFVMNSDGSGVTRLIKNDETEINPVFSPDGRKILYSARRRGGTFDLMVMNADGSQITRLIPGAVSGEFSPDGRRIVFQAFREIRLVGEIRYDQEIYIADSDGENSVQLTPDTGGPSPRFSPDGKRIIFLREVGSRGYDQLMIMNLDGSGLKVIANNY